MIPGWSFDRLVYGMASLLYDKPVYDTTSPEPSPRNSAQTSVRAVGTVCWAIQAGLLTPLTFARHRLSPLAAFISGTYFLHTGRRWQRICEFYTANFKGIFWGP